MGLVLSEVGGGLVDVDCDWPEATALAKELLPRTDLVHGRSSSRGSHYWYRCAASSAVFRLTERLAGRKPVVVELRAHPAAEQDPVHVARLEPGIGERSLDGLGADLDGVPAGGLAVIGFADPHDGDLALEIVEPGRPAPALRGTHAASLTHRHIGFERLARALGTRSALALPN